MFFRNEYRFEWMLRHLAYRILVESNLEKAQEEVRGVEPMLQKLVKELAVQVPDQ